MIEFVKPEEVQLGDEVLYNSHFRRVVEIETPDDERGRRGTRILFLEVHGRQEAGYLAKVPRRARQTKPQ